MQQFAAVVTATVEEESGLPDADGAVAMVPAVDNDNALFFYGDQWHVDYFFKWL